jgi:hypothetical protein
MMKNRIVVVFAVVAVVFALTTGTSAQELITNGDFEATPFDAGWIFSPGTAGVLQPQVGPAGPPDTAAELLNQANANNTTLKQANLGAGTVVVGDIFNISFDAKFQTPPPLGGIGQALFFEEMAGSGASRTEILGGGALGLTANWQTYSFTTTAMNDVAGGVSLEFLAVTPGDGAGTSVVLDNVSMVRVPEPASVAILGLGALGMLLLRRRD